MSEPLFWKKENKELAKSFLKAKSRDLAVDVKVKREKKRKTAAGRISAVFPHERVQLKSAGQRVTQENKSHTRRRFEPTNPCSVSIPSLEQSPAPRLCLCNVYKPSARFLPSHFYSQENEDKRLIVFSIRAKTHTSAWLLFIIIQFTHLFNLLFIYVFIIILIFTTSNSFKMYIISIKKTFIYIYFILQFWLLINELLFFSFWLHMVIFVNNELLNDFFISNVCNT